MSDITDQFLSWQEASDLLRVNKRTLARWYAEGIGPPRIKIGQQVLYNKESLVEWLRSHERKPCRT